MATLTSASSPAEIAQAYSDWSKTVGGDTAANQQTAVDYLRGLGISDTAIMDAYSSYTAPTLSFEGGNYSQAGLDKITGELDLQRQALGGYQGSMDSDWLLNDMATRLAAEGLGSIYDVGKKVEGGGVGSIPGLPEYDPGTTTTYYNKVTGEPLTIGGRKGGDVWGSTGAGSGYTDYTAQMVEVNGVEVPVFLTNKKSSGFDAFVQDFAPVIGIAAMMIPGMQGIGASMLSGTSLAGVAIAEGAVTGAVVGAGVSAIAGGDVLKGAALGALGGAAKGFMAGTTSAEMLSAQSADLLASGFDLSDVSNSLAGLGNAADINNILQGAGVAADAAINASYNTLNTQIPQTISNGLIPASEYVPFPNGEPYATDYVGMENGVITPQPVAADPLDYLNGIGDGYTEGYFDYETADSLDDLNYVGAPQGYFDQVSPLNTGPTNADLTGVVDPTQVLSLPSDFNGNILGDTPAGNFYPLEGSFPDFTQNTIASVPTSSSPTQAEMLAEQYSGFTPEEAAAHLGGAISDPTLVENVLGLMGVDELTAATLAQNAITGGGAAGSVVGGGVSGVLDSLRGVASGLGALTGGGNAGEASSDAVSNFDKMANLIDPYRTYRSGTEIPMMQKAAANVNTLGDLYAKSYSDPLSIYNTPEMQATSGKFLSDIQRRDAAAGRMSQYGARGVEAQNNFLTNTLPAYRTNLNQGLGTLYTAAKPQASNPQFNYEAFKDATQAANTAQQNNSLTGQVSGLINTASNLNDLWNKGSSLFKSWGF